MAYKMRDQSFRLSLLYYSILKQIEPSHFESPRRFLDLGSRDFSYAVGLAVWAKEIGTDSIKVCGLELDPYQTYWNGRKRKEVGLYHASLASSLSDQAGVELNVAYEAGDWLTWNPPSQFDVITHLFPFLFEDLHQGFGLPMRSFSPLEYYAKSIQAAGQGMVFFHQGRKEARESKAILSQLGGGRIVQAFKVQENPYLERKFPIEVLVWKKSEDFEQ